MDTKVIIYSADWCAFCHAAKEYLDKLGVKYTERNIEEDRAFAQEAVDKSHQMGIPVLDIQGDIIVGFDRPKIDDTLKAHKLI
jgi:glutaredoxin 3